MTVQVIYLVDDDDLVREIICGKLREAGYRTEGYADPAAFLAAAADSLEGGCIVLDLEMPGMDGLQVQSCLVDLKCALPVIFYSGKARVSHAVHGIRAGAVDFIQKSSDVSPLLRAVHTLIGRPVPAP